MIFRKARKQGIAKGVHKGSIKLFKDVFIKHFEAGTVSEDYLMVSDPAVCGGKPVIRGTRVPVQYILELWDRGYSAERIHEQYPTVPEELAKKVVELLNKNRAIKILR